MMKKHAYLIIAHNKFDQLKYLISLLDDVRNDIFIHIDKKITLTEELKQDLSSASTKSEVYFTPQIPVYWGHVSLTEAQLLLFETAHKTGQYSMYHLLSGHDLPLVSQDKIHHFFDGKENKIFIAYDSQKTIDNLKLYKLAAHYHLSMKISHRSLGNTAQRVLRAYRRYENKIQTALKIDRLAKQKLQFDYASNWISCGSEVLGIILEEKDWVLKVCQHTFCSDEFHIPLIINKRQLHNHIYHAERMEDVPDQFQGNLRYINWWDGHPYAWTDSDADLAQLDKGIALGHFFSRKFDLEKYPKIKDYIDQNVQS